MKIMNEETPASLKIAQPFMAGITVRTKSKVPQDGRTVLSSLPGLGIFCATNPSAKALGYCRKTRR
jgi:hypothetical protein